METVNPADPGGTTVAAPLQILEQWLREEVKHHRVLLLSLIQWGVTLLAALESSFYFVRRDLAQRLTGREHVDPAEVLSLAHWIFGTILIFLIALLFWVLTMNLLKRYYSYRVQLNTISSTYSEIDDSEVKTHFQWVPAVFFLTFPLF